MTKAICHEFIGGLWFEGIRVHDHHGREFGGRQEGTVPEQSLRATTRQQELSWEWHGLLKTHASCNKATPPTPSQKFHRLRTKYLNI